MTMPFHRIVEWTGAYFQPAALWQVGVKIFLGHCGQRCPNNAPYGTSAESEPVEVTVELPQAQEDDSDMPRLVDRDADDEDELLAPTAGTPEPRTTNEKPPGARKREMPDPEEEAEEIAQAAWEEDIARIRDEFADPDDEIDDLFDPDDRPTSGAIPPESVIVHPKFQPEPPTTDDDDNPYITIVDTSGVHHLPYVQCFCRHQKETDVRFMELELFPASYKRVRTVFTFAVMDDFRLENLECKVSAYQYYHKIRQVTNPIFPDSVPNRYIELRRLSRAWRNLRLRQQFGFSFPGDHSGAGSMAHFCPACPQPGINMPTDWEKGPDLQLKGRTNAMDGNFKSEHVRQKRTKVEVSLDNGLMYMTAPGPYQVHLEYARKVEKKLAVVCTWIHLPDNN